MKTTSKKVGTKEDDLKKIKKIHEIKSKTSVKTASFSIIDELIVIR
jgi:hypothetical protein